MKLREIARFELAYQARRVATWIYFAVLFGFAFTVTRIFRPAEGVFYNAPSVIVFFAVFGGAIWLLVGGATAGEAATRDVETGMHPLTYTAPISKFEYLSGRFVAAFVLNASILFALPAGMLIGLHTRDLDAALLGPFRPAAYLTAYFFILLPNAFVVTAIQFAFAVRYRRAVASYLASVLLLITSHLLVVQLLDRWERRDLLDLMGFAIARTEAWSLIEANMRVIALEGTVLANRLTWLAVALAALTFTHLRFRFSHYTESSSWSRITRLRRASSMAPADTAIAVSTAISNPQVRRTFGGAICVRQTLALAWASFRAIAGSRIGLTLVAGLAMGSALLAREWMTHMDSIPLLGRTGEVIRFLTPPLGSIRTIWLILPLLTILYAGELVWREREAGVSEIADTAPVPEWVLFLGKFLGLGFVLVTWLALLMAAGMLIQVNLGHLDFEVGLYVRALFGLQLADYLLFALLALVVHVLVDQRHLGNLVGLVVYACMAFASWLGIEHNLLVYGADPGWSYTDMAGFGPSLRPWLWFKVYWAAWALLLSVAVRLLWMRGKERSLRARLQLARRRFTRPTARAAAAAMALILAVGGFIFYNTHVLNEYLSATERMERRAEYERRYGRYEGIPQPRLRSTNLHVEIYPERGEAAIRGTYGLVNDTAVAIDSIHVATASGVETGSVAFDRPAVPVIADADHGHRIHALESPLQPGESLRLDFEVHVERHGFGNSGVDPAVVANGTYFTNLQWLPAIGYQPNRELSSAGDRRTHGLPPRPEFPSLYDAGAHRDRSDAGRIAFEAVVGTDEGQIAVAPGALRRTWAAGGRRYFHYVADAPIGNEYALFSARYAVRDGRWNDVAIQIFHHPGHNANLDRMVQSVQASLSYYTAQFGPYPYPHIKIVEYPGYARGMHADTMQITYQEGFSLLNPRIDRGDLDLPFYVVAHEVAHQWWGGQLSLAYAEGLGLLVESLATYSGMRVVEERLGPEHLRRFLRFARKEYETPRTRAAPPLLRALDPFHYYRKGPLAIYAVSEYIGKERVHDALRRLLEKHASGALPLLTSLDLYRELQAVTPHPFQPLLHDLFEKNTFWELETEGVTAAQTEAEAWQVTLDVRARKVVVDESGVEIEVPMNDPVEIGIFDAKGANEPLYLQKHHISAGKQTLTITVPRRPARAGIDPHYLLIDWETDDNVKAVKVQN